MMVDKERFSVAGVKYQIDANCSRRGKGVGSFIKALESDGASKEEVNAASGLILGLSMIAESVEFLAYVYAGIQERLK